MKTTKTQNQKFLPLDEEEAQFMKSLETEDWKSVKNTQKTEFLNIFAQSKIKGSIKTRPISLRLKEPTILALKNKSANSGVPYQTILSALADQYVAGKIKLGL